MAKRRYVEDSAPGRVLERLLQRRLPVVVEELAELADGATDARRPARRRGRARAATAGAGAVPRARSVRGVGVEVALCDDAGGRDTLGDTSFTEHKVAAEPVLGIAIEGAPELALVIAGALVGW